MVLLAKKYVCVHGTSSQDVSHSAEEIRKTYCSDIVYEYSIAMSLNNSEYTLRNTKAELTVPNIK